MALTYIGETEFAQSGPPQWQQSAWDLDTLIIPYSGSQPNLDSFLNSLEKGSPADIDGDMFLMDWRISGTKVYPQVDLVYSGKKNGELPQAKRESNSAVQSSSSATSSAIFPAVATQPVTVTYYAPTNSISYYSRTLIEDPTLILRPGDPASIADTDIITWAINAEQPGSSLPEIVAWLLNNAFVQGLISTVQTEEIVPLQYYRIQKRKTRTLFPYAPPES